MWQTDRHTDRLTFGLLGLLSQPKRLQREVVVIDEDIFFSVNNVLIYSWPHTWTESRPEVGTWWPDIRDTWHTWSWWSVIIAEQLSTFLILSPSTVTQIFTMYPVSSLTLKNYNINEFKKSSKLIIILFDILTQVSVMKSLANIFQYFYKILSNFAGKSP